MKNNIKDHQHRRHHRRFSFLSDAVIRTHDTVWATVIHDISLHGVMAELPQDDFTPSQDDSLQLSFRLVDTDIIIEADVQVVHIIENLAGLAFTAIDVDSMSHLKRLVLLNLGDASLMERELDELLS